MTDIKGTRDFRGGKQIGEGNRLGMETDWVLVSVPSPICSAQLRHLVFRLPGRSVGAGFAIMAHQYGAPLLASA